MANDSPNEINGDVCTILFHIESERYSAEDEMYVYFKKRRETLRKDVDNIIKRGLGEQFRSTSFEVSPGSIDILLTITTIGTVVLGTYVAASKYKNFIESLNLVKEQIKSLFSREASGLTPDPVMVTSSMTLSPSFNATLVDNTQGFSDLGLISFFKKVVWILLIYLVLSHFILLAYFIYSMLREGYLKIPA